MRPIAALALLATIALGGVAAAEDRVRQQLALTADVAAPPEEVWAVIGAFQEMGWHPAVASTEGEGGEEPGATRMLTLGALDGPTIAEVLDGHDEGMMTYSYRIKEVAPTVLPVEDYASELSVRPLDEGGSRVEWSGAFYPAASMTNEAAMAGVTGVYQAGLDVLVERFGAVE